MIVLLGFSCAGYLIWESFDNWQQNPVDTTISTYPIEQVSFPKGSKKSVLCSKFVKPLINDQF